MVGKDVAPNSQIKCGVTLRFGGTNEPTAEVREMSSIGSVKTNVFNPVSLMTAKLHKVFSSRDYQTLIAVLVDGWVTFPNAYTQRTTGTRKPLTVHFCNSYMCQANLLRSVERVQAIYLLRLMFV